MVLDGAVNLSDTAASELQANAVGFEQALDAFLNDCATRKSCAYYHGGDPRAALATLQQRFESGYRVPVADGRQAGATLFYLALAAALYDRANWPYLARALADAERGRGDLLASFADSITGRGADGHFDHLQEALNAIRCDDRPDALVPFDAYRTQYTQYSQQFPIFGAFLAASPIGCDPRLPRPPPSQQVGDVRVTGTGPILIVGTTGDPATPYAGAIDLQQRLTGSRILTLVSTEHAGYAKGISCIDNAVDNYLLHRTLPPVGRGAAPSPNSGRDRRRVEAVHVESTEAAHPPAREPPQPEPLVTGERGRDVGRLQDRPRQRQLGEPAGEVHDRPEVVAVPREHGAGGQAGPGLGEDLVTPGLGGELQRDLGRGLGPVGDEHHLVADRLHDPAPGRGDGVVRDGREPIDERGQLGLLEILRDLGESDLGVERDRHLDGSRLARLGAGQLAPEGLA